jgi:hypothetical protein
MNPTSVTLSSPITRNTSISLPPSTSSAPPKTQPQQKRTFESTFQAIPRHFPTFTHVFVRLPLPLLPFAFSMFILVEALSYVGWIRVFGGWWTSWVRVAGLAGAIFLMGVLSVLGCNVGRPRSTLTSLSSPLIRYVALPLFSYWYDVVCFLTGIRHQYRSDDSPQPGPPTVVQQREQCRLQSGLVRVAVYVGFGKQLWGFQLYVSFDGSPCDPQWILVLI